MSMDDVALQAGEQAIALSGVVPQREVRDAAPHGSCDRNSRQGASARRGPGGRAFAQDPLPPADEGSAGAGLGATPPNLRGAGIDASLCSDSAQAILMRAP